MSKTAIKRTRQKADSIRSDETPQTSQNLSNAGNNQPPEQAATEKGGIREFLKDQQVYVNSIASGLLGLPNGSVLREMGKSRSDMIQFYMSEGGGNKSIEEAIKTVNGPEDEEYVDKLLKDLMSLPVTMVSWYGMEHLHSRAPGIAKAVWQFVKGEARREFESGHRAAQVFEPVDWMKEAWPRARYLAIRESFIDQWKPQGGIDLALIDMLTQSYFFYLSWNEVSVTRTETEMRADPPAWIKDRMYREKDYPREREHGYWNPPYAHEQEAVEHAAQMADRYLRAFQRTLRSMRDLRRYSMPVTINNPQQVNIATDGGQQINAVAEKT